MSSLLMYYLNLCYGSEDPVVLVCMAGSDSSFIKTNMKQPYSFILLGSIFKQKYDLW